MCNCRNLKGQYNGYRVEDILDLAPFVTKVRTDLKNWEREYICNDCGQKWFDIYVSKGHGDIPVTQKRS